MEPHFWPEKEPVSNENCPAFGADPKYCNYLLRSDPGKAGKRKSGRENAGKAEKGGKSENFGAGVMTAGRIFLLIGHGSGSS